MNSQNPYFFVPDRRPFSIVSQYIPQDNWHLSPRLIMYLTSCENTYEIEFGSTKGIDLMKEALVKLQSDSNKRNIQTYVIKQKKEK